MISEYKMLFPFTTQKEILDWATHYTDNQSEKRQRQEEEVIALRKKVKECQTSETPGGYLCDSELRKMAHWKSHYLPSKIDENSPKRIKEVTREALSLDFGLDNDWEKLKKLIGEYGGLYGVGAPVASVILHLYDRGDYPLIDKHALRSIGIDYREVNYDEPFWRKYVNFCRTEAERYDVSMRTLDRALYKYSKSGAVLAFKYMADTTLFRELERRGFDLSRLRESETTGENVKISCPICKVKNDYGKTETDNFNGDNN